jgi:hypothetical protein
MSTHPNPEVWPECSGCATPYVLRRALSFTEGGKWVWMADCRTKTCKRNNDPFLRNADGPIETVDQ